MNEKNKDFDFLVFFLAIIPYALIMGIAVLIHLNYIKTVIGVFGIMILIFLLIFNLETWRMDEK